MVKRFCDRCEKEIIERSPDARTVASVISESSPWYYKDFCDECSSELFCSVVENFFKQKADIHFILPKQPDMLEGINE